MANAGVTVHAGHRVAGRRAPADDLVNELAVTRHAIFLKDARVARLDHDRLVEILEREPLAVPEAVVGLGGPLADKVVRKVTVVACCKGVMAGLCPSIIVGLHDVAVGAGSGVVGKIGRAVSVPKCESPEPAEYPQGRDTDDGEGRDAPREPGAVWG